MLRSAVSLTRTHLASSSAACRFLLVRVQDSTAGEPGSTRAFAPGGAPPPGNRPARREPRHHVLVVAIGLSMAPDGRGRYAWAEDPPWYRLFFVNWLTLPGVSTVRPVSVFGGASCPPDRLYR